MLYFMALAPVPHTVSARSQRSQHRIGVVTSSSCITRSNPAILYSHSQQQTLGLSSLISFVPMSAEATCVAPGIPPFPAAPISYIQSPSLTHQRYYKYNGSFTGASTSTFRPNKRPRPLTEEEAATITRNFSCRDFYSDMNGTRIMARMHIL